MRRRPQSARVRAAAIGLALLAHVLVLLLFRSGNSAPSREPSLLQFVSFWPPDQPAPTVVSPPSQPLRRVPAPSRELTPRSAPSTAAQTAPTEAVAPPTEESPRSSIDWRGEAVRAAARNAAKEDQPQTFSPPPKVVRQPCKPKESSFQWNPEEKKAGLLPLPYVRLGNCIVGLGFFGCGLNGPPPANGHLFDDLQKGDRPVSSIPDPNVCE
jgi:hypothetical protein